jgi:hypothetical protein
MTAFELSSWLACLATSISLGAILRWRRSLFLKPSIIVVTAHHIMIQWAATIESPFIEAYLRSPLEFGLLVHGFPLIGLAVSLTFGGQLTRTILRRLAEPFAISQSTQRRLSLTLAGGILAVVAYYLIEVPFQSTGLYTMFVDPAQSAQARESSLKLLNNQTLKYAFSLMTSSIAPLLSAAIAGMVFLNLRKRQFGRVIVASAALLAIMLAVSLTGARSFAAMILLTVSLAIWLRRGLRFGLVGVTVTVLVVSAAPIALTIFREGNILNPATFAEYFGTAFVRRIVYMPMETALWHAHYAQFNGFFGPAAIPRLAALLDVPSVDVPNLIGLTYYLLGRLDSVSANTSYVYSYYSYFGIESLVVSLVGLWLTDGALLVYARLSDALLLPCVASISVASLGFAYMDYTTVLVTNGFAVILALSLLLDRTLGANAGISASSPLARELHTWKTTLQQREDGVADG